MIEAMLRAVLGCSHPNITRPITPLDRPGAVRCGTYVVCLDCGTRCPTIGSVCAYFARSGNAALPMCSGRNGRERRTGTSNPPSFSHDPTRN